MEDLRRAAREALQHPDSLPDFSPSVSALPDSLHPLWSEISSHKTTSHSKVRSPKLGIEISLIELWICENLLVAQGYLRAWGSNPLSDEDEGIANCLYDWASRTARPSSVFVEAADLEDLPDGETSQPVLQHRSNREHR